MRCPESLSNATYNAKLANLSIKVLLWEDIAKGFQNSYEVAMTSAQRDGKSIYIRFRNLRVDIDKKDGTKILESIDGEPIVKGGSKYRPHPTEFIVWIN